MKRILSWSGKNPGIALSAEETLARDVIRGNVGNYLFYDSTHKILTRDDVEVVSGGPGFLTLDPSLINAEYDHVVIPLANAFRSGFGPQLETLTEMVKRLTVPVTILSVGAQASLIHGTGELSSLDEAVLTFCRAVLDKGPGIGVRGEFTADYLTGLGVPDVEVIGCPSTFMRGPGLRVDKKRASIDYAAKISFSATPQVSEMGRVVMDHVRKFENLTYLPQDYSSLAMFLWGTPRAGFRPSDELPFHPNHPLFQQDKSLYFLDARTWIDFVGTRDFAFGDRIHGNVAAILGGTPALLLAHDSRTLELARYHKIPHMLLSDLEPGTDAVDFYEWADFTDFNAGQQERWDRFASYLARHGLENSFDSPETSVAYDKRLAACDLPEPVRMARPAESPASDRGRRIWGRWLAPRDDVEAVIDPE